jgi:two-component system LytT family response regulator
VAEHSRPDDALAAARALAAELLVLDVDARYPDDVRALRRVPASERPHLLVASAARADAALAYDLGAVDFLLAPLPADRLARALARVRAAMAVQRLRARTHAVATLLAEALDEVADGPRVAAVPPRPEPLVLRHGGRELALPDDAIDWISVDRNDLTVHAGSERHVVRCTLDAIERRLDSARFVRVSRSAIVNVERVRELRPTRAGDAELTLIDGTRVAVSRTQRRRLEAALSRPARSTAAPNETPSVPLLRPAPRPLVLGCEPHRRTTGAASP